jgi:hypothetical protein
MERVHFVLDVEVEVSPGDPALRLRESIIAYLDRLRSLESDCLHVVGALGREYRIKVTSDGWEEWQPKGGFRV